MGMNTNPDERLDQRIRQVLDQLPDAPPPGSTFDAGRLWEQLRPELTAAPVTQPKRPAPVWWALAAACIGLVLGGMWLYNDQDDQSAQVEAGRLPAQKQSNASQPPVTLAPKPDKPETVAHRQRETERIQSSGNRVATRSVSEEKNPDTPVSRSVVPPTLPASTSDEHVAHVTESPSPIPSVAERTPAPAPVPAKRRFRVVHENELLTDEESYRVRNGSGGRAERFVRLGSGSALSAASDETPAQLQVPLQRKQTQ